MHWQARTPVNPTHHRNGQTHRRPKNRPSQSRPTTAPPKPQNAHDLQHPLLTNAAFSPQNQRLSISYPVAPQHVHKGQPQNAHIKSRNWRYHYSKKLEAVINQVNILIVFEQQYPIVEFQKNHIR